MRWDASWRVFLLRGGIYSAEFGGAQNEFSET